MSSWAVARKQLHIVGIGMSPEFVYAVQPGLMLTDNRRFGILWMPRRQMEAAFNMEGAFNDAVSAIASANFCARRHLSR